jgi:hypothetical protein
LQQLQHHIAAIGPAVDGDLLGIDESPAASATAAGKLVLHFDAAEPR